MTTDHCSDEAIRTVDKGSDHKYAKCDDPTTAADAAHNFSVKLTYVMYNIL